MRRVNVRKRGKVYQYSFEAARVNRKRKFISKSGFKTKNAAFIAGQKAYKEYQNGGCKIEGYMSYGDYLDYWLENYCKANLKYRTIEEYSVITNKYLRNFVKVIKCSFRVATDIFGFINYNPAITISLPHLAQLKKRP